MCAEEQVTFHTSLVVLVIDDLTGKPVLGNKVRVATANGILPVVKEDGYRVFVNLRQGEVNVICGSSEYERQERTVDPEKQQDVLEIRLCPKESVLC